MDSNDSRPADDDELVLRARTGDTDAWAALYERHRPRAQRFATKLVGQVDADDLVSAAFERTFEALQRDLGPQVAFRAYLLTAIRNAYVSRIRGDNRLVWTEDHEWLGVAFSVPDPAEALVESSVLAEAFGTLPQRWQEVLWQSLVEGETNLELALRYGMSRNAIAALTFRAREGLRQAYLAQHIGRSTDSTCREVRTLMPAYHRKNLAAGTSAEVGAHLDGCDPCAEVMAELCVLMSPRLGALLGPAVLGFGAAKVLAPAVVAAPAALKALAVLTAGWAAAAAVAVVVGTGGVAAPPDRPSERPTVRSVDPSSAASAEATVAPGATVAPTTSTRPRPRVSPSATVPRASPPRPTTPAEIVRVPPVVDDVLESLQDVVGNGEAPPDRLLPIKRRFRLAVQSLGALAPRVRAHRSVLGDKRDGHEDRRRTNRPSH